MTEAEVRLRRDAATDWRDSTRIKVTAGDLRAVLATLDNARAEATAAAEQRLRERIEALSGYPIDPEEDATSEAHGAVELFRAAVLALLDAAPAPASPRQGEPVEGLDVERLAEALFRTQGERLAGLGSHEADAGCIAAAYGAFSEPAEP